MYLMWLKYKYFSFSNNNDYDISLEELYLKSHYKNCYNVYKSVEYGIDSSMGSIGHTSSFNNKDIIFNSNISISDDVVDESVDESVVVSDDVVDESNIAIEVSNLTMEFKINKDKIDTLKEYVIRSLKRNKVSPRKIKVLDDISFKINKGDRLGILGLNGAGKSTLLKVLAGIYEPTEGNIKINGSIAPLLELGAGFDYNYSGKNNIFLNGAFLGLSEDFLKEKYDEIVEFSELGEHINYPVKNYSSGMRAKLGFSIATMVEPDILIIDEVLSVGDIKFKRKSSNKLKSLFDSGITVILVSHAVGQIRDLCNKAIWIENGKILMEGNAEEVCNAYIDASKS